MLTCYHITVSYSVTYVNVQCYTYKISKHSVTVLTCYHITVPYSVVRSLTVLQCGGAVPYSVVPYSVTVLQWCSPLQCCVALVCYRMNLPGPVASTECVALSWGLVWSNNIKCLDPWYFDYANVILSFNQWYCSKLLLFTLRLTEWIKVKWCKF